MLVNKKLAITIISILLITIYLIGCNNNGENMTSVPVQPQSSTVEETLVPAAEQTTPESLTQIVFNEKLEYYYDYFRNNNQIVVLLDYNKNGFSDDQLAAFAILSLDNYDYENGNPKEDYHAITEKYFGRKIKNFNNSSSEIIPGTNMVRATGWSYNSNVFLILKNLLEEEGIKTAEFYMLNISDSIIEELPKITEDGIKKDLLSGDFSGYGEPFILKMKFEEKVDEAGNKYLKYLEIKIVDEIIETIIPYGAQF